MRAVTCADGRLDTVELPDPVPGRGQVLLGVRRAGICGSDLHARHDADTEADLLQVAGYSGFMRSSQQVVFGHEFSGEVLGYGPQCRARTPVGSLVTRCPCVAPTVRSTRSGCRCTPPAPTPSR